MLASSDKLTPNTYTYCEHYVERKKRRCKLLPLKHSKYCAEHAAHHSSSSQSEHIPCPLDPAHFISRSRLEQHLKICNARKYDYTSQPYYSENVNVVPCHGIEGLLKEPLSKLAVTELIGTCVALLKYGAESKVCEMRDTPTVSDVEIDRYRPLFQNPDDLGNSAKKHATQQIALVNCLPEFYEGCSSSATISDTCFVELGAGTGKLSQWFHFQERENFFVLVDRQICRNKADSYFKKEKSNYVRFKMDIKDIDVSGVPEAECYNKICFACKHLCGGATDLALVAASRTALQRQTTVLIALCCHHLCSWELYTGKDYFLEHFKPERFYTLCSLSAWATCFKIETIHTHDTHLLNRLIQDFLNAPESFIQQGRLVLDKSLQWCIGRCAKMVLNDGRAEFMERNGFFVQFSRYVDVNVSPENTALLCYKNIAA